MATEKPEPRLNLPNYGKSPLGETITALRLALLDEIEAASRDPGRKFTVEDGVRVLESDEEYLYQFKSDIALPIPPDTPISIYLDNDEIVPGAMIGLQDFDVFLTVKRDLGKEVSQAKISSEPWFIWKKLSDRLEEIQSEPAQNLTIPLALLNHTPVEQRIDEAVAEKTSERLKCLKKMSMHPNESQRAAMARCAGSALHYVWGPPGTGKTANLAHVAATLANRGERVLVLAHTNVAVDVAILRVAEAFEGTDELESGQILRIGVPQLLEVRKRGDITPEDAVAKVQPDLIRRKYELESQKDIITKKLQRIKDPDTKRLLAQKLDEVRKELTRILEEIRAAIASLIAKAKILAATLSRFSLDDLLFSWPAHAILIDEASMAPFPAVLAAGIRASRRMSVFGDFRQLPPIVLSSKPEARDWIGRDAFEIAGIVDAVDASENDPRITLLNKQYRMSPNIATVVSNFAYGGKLITADGVEKRNANLVQFEPLKGHSTILIDTTLLDPSCIREPRVGSYSRVNHIHAAFAVSLAETLLSQGCPKVAIVTPYRAQAKLVSSFLHDHPEGNRLRAATVHRFQGSESEAVIVDIVDAPEIRGSSQLTGKNRDTSRRLLNVALSRAQGKLFVLVHNEFTQRTQRPTEIVPTIVSLLRAHGTEWRPLPTELLSLHGNSIEWFDCWASAEPVVQELLSNAGNWLRINIPHELKCSDSLLAHLHKAAKRVKDTIVYATINVAEALEDTQADIRLMNQPGGFFVLADHVGSVMGGRNGTGCFASIKRKKVVESLESLLLGDALRRPAPQADIQHSLDAACGRCPNCGKIRRPLKGSDGKWRLACAKYGHTAEPLAFDAMREIVRLLQIKCDKCGGDAQLRKSSRSLFLGCANYSAGCVGKLPSLETLF